MRDLDSILQRKSVDSRLNTSYPLSPSDWAQYRVNGPLPFAENTLSFYIHIPFCKSLCSFCEYARTICPEESTQMAYIQGLNNDIETWIVSHNAITLKGFDIGGGTPTALNESSFQELIRLFVKITNRLHHSPDYEPSIEGTFQTLSERKLQFIRESGIDRLSLGIQSVSPDVLDKATRKAIPLTEAIRIRNLIKSIGISKLNLDLMYGLNRMDLLDCRRDLEWIKELDPEQVTLYEFRPNMVTGNAFADVDSRYAQYSELYDGLCSQGYYAEFGANTFSKDISDLGVSSYLRSRMCENVPYKGFGISAQSMSCDGISYNVGKGTIQISNILYDGGFPEEFTYILPAKERLAKYIAISAYSGRFSIDVASQILGMSYLLANEDVITFLESKGLISVTPNQISITRKGFKSYGAVFSMLYDIADK